MMIVGLNLDKKIIVNWTSR